MLANCIKNPLLNCYQGIPVGIKISCVFEDVVIVPNMYTDSNETGMNIQPNTIGLQNLYINAAVIFGMDNDLNSSILRHKKYNSCLRIAGRQKKEDVRNVNFGGND